MRGGENQRSERVRNQGPINLYTTDFHLLLRYLFFVFNVLLLLTGGVIGAGASWGRNYGAEFFERERHESVLVAKIEDLIGYCTTFGSCLFAIGLFGCFSGRILGDDDDGADDGKEVDIDMMIIIKSKTMLMMIMTMTMIMMKLCIIMRD